MMKSWATRVPLRVLEANARRSVEWLVMGEDLPDPANRVTLTAGGRIRTGPGRTWHAAARAAAPSSERLMRSAGYDIVATQPFDISMNSHMCGRSSPGWDAGSSVLDRHCKAHDLSNLWVVDGAYSPRRRP